MASLEQIRADFEKAETLRLQADAMEEQHKEAISLYVMERLKEKCEWAGINFEILSTYMPMDESHHYTVFVAGIYNHGDYKAIDKLAMVVEEELGIDSISVFSLRDTRDKQDGQD